MTEKVRFCPECGCVGEVQPPALACCPDHDKAKYVTVEEAHILKTDFNKQLDEIRKKIAELGFKTNSKRQARRLGQYILESDGKTPKECIDIIEWGTFMEDFEKRRVGKFNYRGVFLSTMFLGLDHDFFNRYLDNIIVNKPILWETMIFGINKDSDPQYRYTSYDEALKHFIALRSQLIMKINRFRKMRKPKWKR